MASTYRKRDLRNTPQTPAHLEPLRGSQIMRRSQASAVHETGDRVLSSGRRILATVGLHGAASWHVSDDAVDSFVSHPDPSVTRVVMRTPALALTPGHFPRVMLVANPSGMTGGLDGMGASEAKGAQGRVVVSAVFTSSVGSVTVTRSLSIPASEAAEAAQPAGIGAAWLQLYTLRSDLMVPVVDTGASVLAPWCKSATVTLTIGYRGSPRAVDVVVTEEPFIFSADLADPSLLPLHSNGLGQSIGQLGGPVPVTRKSAADPCGGVEVVADAAARLCQEHGPILWSWTSWNEGAGDFASTEAPPVAITGTAYTEIVSGSTTTYATASAGASLSSGANARRVQESAAALVLRDKTNVVPVRLWVYAAMSTAVSSPTGTVRFESAGYSIGEVAIPAGTAYAWRSVTAHLRCGLGAQDPTALQVRAKVSTATFTPAVRIRYLAVEFADL